MDENKVKIIAKAMQKVLSNKKRMKELRELDKKDEQKKPLDRINNSMRGFK